MEMYHAALLHLRQQAHSFAQAFGVAAAEARRVDPQSELTDPLAATVAREVTELLRTTCAFVPGAREVLLHALYQYVPKES